MKNFMNNLTHHVAAHPRITILALTVMFLGTVAWKGADAAVPFAVTIAFISLGLVSLKQAD